MTGLVTLRDPAVLPAAPRGDFDGDRFGLAAEPLPPIVRRLET